MIKISFYQKSIVFCGDGGGGGVHNKYSLPDEHYFDIQFRLENTIRK